MVHKAWCYLGEAPYCFSIIYESLKFQGHTAQKSSILTQIGRLRSITPVWSTNGYEMMHKAWSSIEEVPYCFSRSSVKFQGHTEQKNRQFWLEFSNSGLKLTDGFEMMDKA